MADNGKIDVDGLPARPAGNLDSIVGVDKATRQAAQFPVTALPMPQGVVSALQRQDQAIAKVAAAQGNAMVPYETAADLPGSDPGEGRRLAWVWGDASLDNNGAWAWDGGWEKSADRVSALEAKVPRALSESDYAAKSSVLQSLGVGNKWEDFDFSGAGSYLGSGTFSLEETPSRTVLRMATGERRKGFSPSELSSVFSFSIRVLGKGASSGVPRVLLYQSAGATEIPGSRRTYNLGTASILEPRIVAFEGIALEPTATRVDVMLDAGVGGDVRFSEPSMVDGPIAGFVGYEREAPLRINQFVDPDFIGHGVDGGQNAGSQVVVNGHKALELSAPPGAPLTPVRSYYVPATGPLAPGNRLRLMVEAISDTPTGCEVAILFRNSFGGEISGARLTHRTSVAEVWNARDGSVTIPAETTQVQFRFTLWAAGTGATFGRYRKLWLFANDSGADVDESKVLNQPSSSGVSVTSALYVNAAEGDDGNSGSEGAPLKTVTAAIAALGGTGNIIVQDGDIDPVNLSAAVDVRISAARDAVVRIMSGTRIDSDITKTPGRSKVYQAPLPSAPVGGAANWVWEHGVPSLPIPAAERHPSQRGATHRLPSTRLWPVASIAEIDAATEPSWYWESGTLYFSISGGADATSSILYVPGGARGVSGAMGAHVEFNGVESWYGLHGFDLTGCRSYRLHRCRAIASRSNGFVRDGAFGVEVACEAGGNGNDGFGTHNTLGQAAAARTHGLFIDQWSHDNGDDGCSEHERSDATYQGGLNEHNGDRGMATSYGANVVAVGMRGRKNGQIDTSGGEGFATVGEANPSNDGGVGTQMHCINCTSDGDLHGFRAGAGNVRLIAEGCRTFDAVNSAFTAAAGGYLELIDCSDSGSSTVKSGSGTIMVRNTDLVT